MSNRCFRFEEWFEGCREAIEMYRTCYDECMRFAKDVDERIRCQSECEKKVIENGKKHSFSDLETMMCLYML